MKAKINGGARPGAGRKPHTPEQRAERDAARRQVVIDELLFPAIVTAFKGQADQFGDRYLEVDLSKVQIEQAYGREGLAEWMSYFSVERVGGRFANGTGFPTRWRMNISKYGLILKFIESLGHDVKSLPDVWFPPDAMRRRLEVVRAKQIERQERKLERQWKAEEARATRSEAVNVAPA